MERDQIIEFLRHKIELIAGRIHLESERAAWRDRLGAMIDHLAKFPAIPLQAIRSMDRGLEQQMKHGLTGETDQAEIHATLAARFGVGRLQDEAPGRPRARRPAETRSLAEHEADEKVCPGDTAVATMEAFIQLKYELIVGRTREPAIRQMLAETMKWGTQFIASPSQPHQRDGWRHLEHELECFSEAGFSPADHRAVRDELERRFGFRRLGPSPRTLTRAMLAAGVAPSAGLRLRIERYLKSPINRPDLTPAEVRRAREILYPRRQPAADLSQPVRTVVPPASRMTRAKYPPDLSPLCVGGVFQLAMAENPVRVVAWDEVEVFYDSWWPTLGKWTFGDEGRTCVYYRMSAAVFLEGAARIRIDEPTAARVALHRPDLPLRLGRSRAVEWTGAARADRERFLAHLADRDPGLLAAPPLAAARVVLLPRGQAGRFGRAGLVAAADGRAIPVAELLWRAHQLQAPLQKRPSDGIGLYRAGLAQRGTPSYFIGEYFDPGGSLVWLEANEDERRAFVNPAAAGGPGTPAPG